MTELNVTNNNGGGCCGGHAKPADAPAQAGGCCGGHGHAHEQAATEKKCACGPDCTCGCQQGEPCRCGEQDAAGKVLKTCACGPDCTCGCAEGKPCTCGAADKAEGQAHAENANQGTKGEAAQAGAQADAAPGALNGHLAEQGGQLAGQATYRVSGMTCEHCVKAITEEVSAIPGVRDVQVDLASGRLQFASDAPVDFDRVVEAVSEAGDYTVE